MIFIVDYLNPFLWFSGAIIEPMTLLVIFMIGIPIIMFLILFLIEVRNSKKSLILYFETENLLNSLLTKIKDGRIFLGKKQISVDKASTLHMRTGFMFKSYKPVYVIKHNLALPLHFTKAGIKVYTGENLKHLVENKTLEQLLKPKGADKQVILFLVIGAVIGILCGILLADFIPKGSQVASTATPVAGIILNKTRTWRN